jgi:beta-glucanase (GH16 family)
MVHTEDGSNGPLPITPGRIMINFWPGIGVDDWLNPFTYTAPLESQYDWIRYQPTSVIYLPQIVKPPPQP